MRNSVLILLTILFTGCSSDLLDEPVLGVQTIDNYYSNATEAEYAVVGAYASLSPEDWWEMDFFWLIGDVCSDDAFKGNTIVGDQLDFGNMADFNINPNNEWLDVKWRYSYITISRVNLIIENVSPSEMDEDRAKQFIAEAKFLRAFTYFELVKNFGGVPLALEQLSPNEAQLERATEEQVWNQIIEDLESASTDLPSRADQPANYIGRATQQAAWAYLAKANLFAENWAKAQEYAEMVVQSGQYDLEPDFGDVWSLTNPNGVESVFEIQHNYDDVFYVGNALPAVTRSRSDGGWGFATPSSNLAVFMAGDARLAHTIITQGDSIDADHPSYDTNLAENESGRNNRKYYLSVADRSPLDEHVTNGLNHILMRYADLLLIHAEAAYRNSQEGSAQSSLNRVRARVGLAAITPSGEDLLTAVRGERRKELALEGHRYYDLKRWGILEEAITDFVDYNLNRSSDQYDSGDQSGELFDASKHYLFPIPQTEVDLSQGRIQQNPSY